MRCSLRIVAWLLAVACVVQAADPQIDRATYEKTSQKAISFLLTKGQAEDGSFSKFGGPAITALCVTGILQNGHSPDEPGVKKSLKLMESYVQPDGGIYAKDSLYKNYETCLSVLCFTAANKDGRYAKVLKDADKFLKSLQWDESEGINAPDMEYGGQGYGNKKRPDLSNTAFFVEALKATGNDADSEAIKKALIFISRCQNLESEHNTAAWVAKNPDNGFIYTPAGGGDSQAGKLENGGLRSYASMTYAGLKSMIHAGVGPKDKRVVAAVSWLRKNYNLKQNPGMGEQGLFYYYQTFAKALDAYGEEVFVEETADKMQVKHAWRAELLDTLTKHQKADGSFVNENPKWMEGDANLTTAYALLALSYCKPKN